MQGADLRDLIEDVFDKTGFNQGSCLRFSEGFIIHLDGGAGGS